MKFMFNVIQINTQCDIAQRVFVLEKLLYIFKTGKRGDEDI